MADLARMLLPDTPVLEILLRGTLTYLVLFGILRVTLNRSSSSIGMTDLLVIVLIADAAQNAMADDYRSWTDGMLLVLTIVGWAYGLDWLAFRYPDTLGRWINPTPRVLVRDGTKVQRNLDAELISDDELLAQLRLRGVTDLRDVRLATMEAAGEVSVITTDDAPGDQDAGATADRRP